MRVKKFVFQLQVDTNFCLICILITFLPFLSMSLPFPLWLWLCPFMAHSLHHSSLSHSLFRWFSWTTIFCIQLSLRDISSTSRFIPFHRTGRRGMKELYRENFINVKGMEREKMIVNTSSNWTVHSSRHLLVLLLLLFLLHFRLKSVFHFMNINSILCLSFSIIKKLVHSFHFRMKNLKIF